MDEEIDRLMIGVRADTSGFARDVAQLKAALEQGVGSGADRAGRSIETALSRAVRTGKFGFEDLKKVALGVLEEIAAASIKGAIGGGAGGGLGNVAAGLLGTVLGMPGRATGGPVSPGAAYVVGERGPELFVPTASGAIAPAVRGGGRDVRVSIAITASGDEAPRALARSGRQVARAVSRALAQAEG